MINYRIRIKQIRKALFISRKIRPYYGSYILKLESLCKAMMDIYCPCNKEIWPEVNRWYKMRGNNEHYHHKAKQISRLISAYFKEIDFAQVRYEGKEHWAYSYKERRKIASYWRHWDD